MKKLTPFLFCWVPLLGFYHKLLKTMKRKTDVLMRLEKATFLLSWKSWLVLAVLSYLLLNWIAGIEIPESANPHEMASAAVWQCVKTAAGMARIPVPCMCLCACVCSIPR